MSEITEEIIATFAKHINPTGGDHSPLPWGKDGLFMKHSITGQHGVHIATFSREVDRDLALYFTNVHPAMISMLRTNAEQMEFIARVTNDQGIRHIATEFSVTTRALLGFFERLGKAPPADGDKNESGSIQPTSS